MATPGLDKHIIVVSGPSGAGKSTAARALEDLGFFVVDNLPPQLISTLVNLSDSSGNELSKLAFVIDAREAQFLEEFPAAFDKLKNTNHRVRLLFLDADDETLVTRFKETRRRHPLEAGEGVASALKRERELLNDLLHRADLTIDTREMSVHELKKTVQQHLEPQREDAHLLTVMSFGFKHGLPPELDLCFDVRFLPNPYFDDDMRSQTGLDAPVSTFVLGQPDAKGFLDRVYDFASFLLPRFSAEGKAYVTIAIGCTGGRHRSVALAEALGKRLTDGGMQARVVHRDSDKWN